MKILIYGAGIVGITYGWQLSKAGHDITIMVRQGKKQFFEKKGIPIHCSDFRSGQKQVEQVVFHPKNISLVFPLWLVAAEMNKALTVPFRD